MELLKCAHSVGESNLHMQFTPAYRREIFARDDVRILTRDYTLSAARFMGIEILAIGFGTDHVHLFIRGWKNFSIAELARRLKGFTSRMMRKHHSALFRDVLYGRKFWSSGYFYRTVGAVNSETVRRYVLESQDYSYAELPVQARIEFFIQ